MTNTSSELQELIEMLGEYLSQNYEFRHNVLSDTYEFRECSEEDKPFRALTREARNTIIRHIKCDGLEIPNIGQNVDEILSAIGTEFPTVKTISNVGVRLGLALKAQNYKRKRIPQGSAYYIIPKKSAA